MLVGCLTAFTMLSYGFISCTLKGDRDFIKRLVLSQIYFWCAYTLVSGFLIWINCFSVRTAILGTFVAAVVIIAGLLWRRAHFKKKDEQVFQVHKKYLPIIALCAVGVYLIGDKFGLYGLSQDEGVYQTTAISYIYSNNDNQKDLQEYGLLNEGDRERFKDKMAELRDTAMHGFYRFDEGLKPRDIQEKKSEVSGYYHGVGTYPAQLALWGWIVGFEKMMGVQSVFWVLAVLLAYLAVDLFQISRWMKVLLTGIYGILPVMAWTGRASLTELFLACLMNFFIYELCKEKSPNALLMALPIITFAFFHMSVFSIMPIVCICFAVRYWYRRDNTYLVAGVLAILGYIAGTLYISWSHTEYFYLNVAVLLKLPFATQDNIIAVMALLGILGCAMFLLLWKIAVKMPGRRVLPGKWPLWAGTIALTAAGIFQVVRRLCMEDYHGNPTLLSYCVNTGLVLLPLCVVLILWFSTRIWRSSRHVVITLLFLYCILFYAVVYRVETLYHYYGDRYLLPYIFLVPMLAAALLEFGWHKTKCQIISLICAAAAVAYIIPHDIFILEHEDDTRMQWDTLLEIADKLEPGDMVILLDDVMTSCFFPLRDIAGVSCFPVFGTGVADTYYSLRDQGKDVYLLGNGTEIVRQDDEYTWTWNVSCYEYMEDVDCWDPLAMEQMEVVQTWILQKIDDQI